MKLKLEWCTSDNTPYIEKEFECIMSPTTMFLTPNPPSVIMNTPAASIFTYKARVELSGYVEDIREKLTNLIIHLEPDINEIDYIDWM